jgi:hypothetical protein
MAKQRTTPASVADEIRLALKGGGSSKRSSGVQRFFKEEVQSHGWRTPDLRRAALRWRREILQQSDLRFLLQVADHLFKGKINEEKNVAVFLLENITPPPSAIKNSDCSSHGCPGSATGLTMMRWRTI